MKKCILLSTFLGLFLISNAQDFQGIKFNTSHLAGINSGFRTESIQEGSYVVILEALDNGGSSVFIKYKENKSLTKKESSELDLDGSVVQELNGEDIIKIYPNPVTQFLTVSNTSGASISLILYNSSGAQVAKFDNIENFIDIPKQKLAKGTLIYAIFSGEELLKKGRINVE